MRISIKIWDQSATPSSITDIQYVYMNCGAHVQPFDTESSGWPPYLKPSPIPGWILHPASHLRINEFRSTEHTLLGFLSPSSYKPYLLVNLRPSSPPADSDEVNMSSEQANSVRPSGGRQTWGPDPEATGSSVRPPWVPCKPWANAYYRQRLRASPEDRDWRIPTKYQELKGYGDWCKKTFLCSENRTILQLFSSLFLYGNDGTVIIKKNI